MPAYLIVNIDLRDAEAYKPYIEAVPPIVARHGGEYLVRGGAFEIIEGTWQPHRLVLFRFPDRAAIRAFVDDPDYAPFKALRLSVATTDSVAVDGIA